MRKIAVTGGLSCGKSTVCKLLKDLGAYCVSADEIVHQLLSPTTPIGQEIIQLLGEEIVNNGEFDRNKIAKKVFESRETLTQLERILHPAVLERVEDLYEAAKQDKQTPLFVAEIPLLYEIESAHLFDAVVAVKASAKLAKERFKKDPDEEFEKRMTHQLPIEEKCAQADYVVVNEGSFSDLKDQVTNLFTTLTQ